jgi:inner membrane protein
MQAGQTGHVMNPAQPPVIAPTTGRWNAITLKLLFIAGLVLLLQAPLHLVNSLQQERRLNNTTPEMVRARQEPAPTPGTVFEAYRMVERALKHSVLVLALVFSAFFLFETLTELRLHPVHYGLVGAAMCLFYLALLALGEVVAPGLAYVGAAGASSLLVTLYSAAVLRSWVRAGIIGVLLAGVHGVLYIVLRMENYALLAGTAALFVALGAVMFLTRNVDWHTQDAKPTGGAA